MRTVYLAVALLAAGLSGPAQAAAGVEGVWRTESGEQAQMYACGKAICVKLLTGDFKDTMLSQDLAEDGAGVWSGSLFNPGDGKTYAGSATLAGDSSLKLKGCALKIFCKTQTWTRVK